jgi:hypothetical protein
MKFSTDNACGVIWRQPPPAAIYAAGVLPRRFFAPSSKELYNFLFFDYQV